MFYKHLTNEHELQDLHNPYAFSQLVQNRQPPYFTGIKTHRCIAAAPAKDFGHGRF